MCQPNEEPPRGNLRLFMTVVLVIVAAKIDTITADVVCVIFMVYVMTMDYRHRL